MNIQTILSKYGKEGVFCIAEIGNNHKGDFQLAKELTMLQLILEQVLLNSKNVQTKRSFKKILLTRLISERILLEIII